MRVAKFASAALACRITTLQLTHCVLHIRALRCIHRRKTKKLDIPIAQMFKVVLSRVFDLRCNLDEISGAGEPLLLFSKEEGEAAASKAKKASSSSSSSSPTEGAADARKGAAK